MTQVRFVSRPTFGDVVRVSIEQTFQSLGAQAVHGFGWGVAIFGLLAGAPPDIWVPPALIGVVMGSGLLFVAFQWWIYGRRPERLVETVTADQDAILIETAETQSRQRWAGYRDAQESSTAFLLVGRRALSQVLAKRDVSDAALEEFRALLRGAGLLREGGQSVRGVVGFVAGAAIAIAMPFLLGLVRFE